MANLDDSDNSVPIRHPVYDSVVPRTDATKIFAPLQLASFRSVRVFLQFHYLLDQALSFQFRNFLQLLYRFFLYEYFEIH